MNDQTLRRKLCGLRVPPPNPAAAELALERALAARTQFTGGETSLSEWRWRDWLWPSPLVWGAMAAVWIMVAARGTNRPTNDSGHAPLVTEDVPESASPPQRVFFRHEYYALLREVQQSPAFR